MELRLSLRQAEEHRALTDRDGLVFQTFFFFMRFFLTNIKAYYYILGRLNEDLSNFQ